MYFNLRNNTFADEKKKHSLQLLIANCIKGTVHRFTWGVHGTVSSLVIRFTLSVFHFTISVAATVDLMMSRIGPIAPLLLLVDYFGPICYTIKSTAVATGIEKKKIKNT